MEMIRILTSRIFSPKPFVPLPDISGTQMHGQQKLLSTTLSACVQSAKKGKSTATVNAPFLLVARASEDPPVFQANKVIKAHKCYTRAPCSRNFTSCNRCLIPRSRLQPEMQNSSCGFALDPGYPRDGLVLLLLTSEFESVSFLFLATLES